MLKPIKDINFLTDGDIVDGLCVQRTSSYNVFFDNGKRKSWRRVKKEIESGVPVLYRNSPQVEVDWSNREQVSAYLKSFTKWGTYRSGVTKSNYGVIDLSMCEVKDGLIFYDGEWWVNGPCGTYNDWGKKVDKPDCLYDVELCRVPNTWWGNISDVEKGKCIMINLFFINKDYPVEWRDRKLSMLGI